VKLRFPKFDAELVAEIESYLDQDYQTEVIESDTVADLGLRYTVARGATSGAPTARRANNYVRPMIQVINNGASSSGPQPGTSCGACGDFSRTWACAEHPELNWDSKRRYWDRPCTGDRDRCECDSCWSRRTGSAERSNGWTSDGTDGLRSPQGLYDQLVGMFGQPLPQDPYQGIRGYVPVDGRDYFTPEQRAAERARQMTEEARLNHFRQSFWEVGSRPPSDFPLALEGTFHPGYLEITGETVQNAGSVRIEVEDDDTR